MKTNLYRRLYAILLAFAVPFTVAAQPADDLSPSLANAISASVQIDVNELNTDTLAAIDVLELNGVGAIDFSGLELLTTLHTLHLSGNSLGDLSFLSGLTTLRNLSLKNNRISDLSPLSNLDGLTDLDLSNNLVENLGPLSTLSSLTQLHLASNAIRDLGPLSGLTNLTTLNISSNRINGLTPLKSLANLSHLRVANNSVEQLDPIPSLKKLNYLDFSNNRITQLDPLAGLSNLDILLASGNPIKSLKPLASLKKLTVLLLRGSSFGGDLTPIAELSSLKRLDAPHSDIRSIKALANLIALRRIDLSHNRITDIGPLAPIARSLLHVNLEGNPLGVESRGVYLNALREKVQFEGDKVNSPRALSDNFEKVDADKNAALSYLEAKKAYPALSVLEFDALDGDKNWNVTRAELFDLVRALPDSLDIAWLGPELPGKGLGTKANPFRSFREAQLALKEGGSLMLLPGARVDSKSLKKTIQIESPLLPAKTKN